MTGARRELIEVGTGTAVVLALLVFLVLAYTNSRAGDLVGYDVLARFSRVDGVAIGTEVRAAGIPVGRVVTTAIWIGVCPRRDLLAKQPARDAGRDH